MQIAIDMLKTNRVQVNEKFLIKEMLFLPTKNNKMAPIAGNKQKRDNI
jgi:hypothetical protein